MPTLPNPAEQLAPIVSKLYELAGNSGVSEEDRTKLILQAHDLRGDLLTLVAMQLSQDTAAYQETMKSITQATDALTQAEQGIKKTVDVINSIGQLAVSIDGLLKEAVAIAGKV